MSVSENLPTPNTPPFSDVTREMRLRATSTGNSHIFGSFWIDESEFALPVGAIREVVNEPSVISAVPLAPPLLKGLFNLRGMIIPVIDLRTLLEFPEKPDHDSPEDQRKVAIIENGDKCVGILFDRAGEVLNEPGSARVNFRAGDEGIKDVVIDGVLKLDNGDRMVQILDPYEMLRIERVPQAEATELAKSQKGDLGKRLSCVAFQLGHTYCAIDLRYVQEVRDMPPVDKSLIAHGYIIGTSNLRGQIIPVIDFRSFMGDEPAFKLGGDALSKRKMLVMKSEGGVIGLMVFSIDSILPFFESDILPFAKLALPRGNIVKGCLVSEKEHLIMLLDHDRLRSDPGLTEAALICQEVHTTGTADTAEVVETKRIIERRTFILFSISSCFAMDTCSVSEVINKPDALLEPPYALEYVEGIINLRGELITLINLRLLYGLDPFEGEEQKVLIFRHNSQKYAILVDSVDEIVMTTAEHVSADKKTGFNEALRSASDDVSGVLHVPRDDDSNLLVMIMDVEALVARCLKASTKS